MNILFDARVLGEEHISGVGFCAQHLLQSLLEVNTKHQITLFFNASNQKARERFLAKWVPLVGNRPDLHKIVIKKLPNKIFSFGGNYYLRNHQEFADYDLVHCPHLNLVSPQSVLKIATVHDVSFVFFPEFLAPKVRIWHRWMSRQVRQADFLITSSYQTKEDLLKVWGISSEKIQVIYPGVEDLVSVSLSLGVDSAREMTKSPYILHLGSLEPRKNISGLLAAFRDLIMDPDFADYNLVLAGQPAYQFARLQRQYEDLIDQKRVILTGYVDQSQKISLLKAASLLVYPSFYEGFGFPPLEAMQFGVPVLASNQGSIPEIVGEAGLLFDPYDQSGFVDSLKKIVVDTNLRIHLSQLGYKQVKKFSWDKTASQVLELYERVGAI